MKKLMLTVLVVGLFSNVFADDDHDDHDDYKKGYYTQKLSQYSELYKAECASCHMGYQAKFLPAKNWAKMMNNLDDHFGVDAAFDKADEEKILNYLRSNSSNRSYVNEDIIEITKLNWFKKEHRKIPTNAIKQKEVRSLSNCKACHTRADSGSYRERDIKIPNYGWWDD